jgi:flagellar motor protein MotB
MRQRSLLVLFILTMTVALRLGPMSSPSASAASQSVQARVADKTPERLDALEARAKDLEDKIDRAALKNDYIQQTQKQYETYYEKAFSTQIQILTILGIILSVLLFLAGRIGLKIFDRQIQLELKSATDSLRLEFENKLSEQLRSLAEKNTTQVKELEEGLKSSIAVVQEDLQLRSDFLFQFFMGASAYVDKDYDGALIRLRRALRLYKQGRQRSAVPLWGGETTTRFIFYSIKNQGPEFAQLAQKELENDVYKDLGEELTEAAKRIPELSPLLS